MHQPITCYHVVLVEGGKDLITGQLNDLNGAIKTYPGVTNPASRTFASEDLPPEVEIRTIEASNGNRINNRVSGARARSPNALAIASRRSRRDSRTFTPQSRTVGSDVAVACSQ